MFGVGAPESVEKLTFDGERVQILHQKSMLFLHNVESFYNNTDKIGTALMTHECMNYT